MPIDTLCPSISVRIVRRIGLNLCRVSLGGDLHERAADLSLALPLSRPRAQRIARISEAGILFVHVPKCAGMAVCEALYGTQLKHGTIRWYRCSAPQLDGLPSFAVIHEPVERFLSAYRYATRGGSADNRVARAFHARYRAFSDIEDAIRHVETAASPYRVDHIFRPQHWYVTDEAGAIGVDRLFEIDDPALRRLLGRHGAATLTPVNCSTAPRPVVTPDQADRIRALYSRDIALHAALSADHRRPIAFAAVPDTYVAESRTDR